MAFSNTTIKTVYTANGSNTAFAIPYTLIQSDSQETKVYKRDNSTTPATITTAVEGVDYDLTGRATPADFNTTVTFRSAPTAGLLIQIERELALTQPFNPISNGQIYLPDHNTAYDRAIALIQQLYFSIQRSPRFTRTSGISDYFLPDPEANKIIGYNSSGTGFKNLSASDILNLTGALAISNNLSDLSNVTQALINLGISPLTVQNKISFTDGQTATNASGETVDGTVYTSVVYEYEVIRGTTVVATGRLSLQYKNSTWGVVDGGYEGDVHGLTFSVSQTGTTAQLRIAASSSGGGNGTVKLKKHYFKV